MELHLSQLATAGVLGEKGESVHPYYQCLLTCLLIAGWGVKLIAQLPLSLHTWKRKPSHKQEEKAVHSFFFLFIFLSSKTISISCCHLPSHPRLSHPLRLTSLILSQSASVHQLKVDFLCPSVSPLNSLLPCLCSSVLCGGDNGNNYTSSMSVPQHSSSNSSTSRLWHHDVCCLAISYSAESKLKGLHMVMRKKTDINEWNGVCFYIFCTKYVERWQTAYEYFYALPPPPSFCKYFSRLEYVMRFQWDLLESSLTALLR